KGATIRGGSIILDSSADIRIDSDSTLDADTYQFNAGRVALMLQSGLSEPGDGLVISNGSLSKIDSASSLGLLSYSSIDLYGNGSFGSRDGLAELTLSAGAI